MLRNGWVAERAGEFVSLRGRHIASWTGVEMALRDNAPGGAPQFDDPQVPCLQLLGLQASLQDGGVLSVTTYHDDDCFGLRSCLEAKLGDDNAPWEGIYRRRPLAELPAGAVGEVSVFADEGVIAEVRLEIGTRPLLLIAGELDETPAGALLFHRLDESVLVFTDPAATEAVPWTTSRRDLALIQADGPARR